jgi:hypothetical protein
MNPKPLTPFPPFATYGGGEVAEWPKAAVC